MAKIELSTAVINMIDYWHNRPWSEKWSFTQEQKDESFARLEKGIQADKKENGKPIPIDKPDLTGLVPWEALNDEEKKACMCEFLNILNVADEMHDMYPDDSVGNLEEHMSRWLGKRGIKVLRRLNGTVRLSV